MFDYDNNEKALPRIKNNDLQYIYNDWNVVGG